MQRAQTLASLLPRSLVVLQGWLIHLLLRRREGTLSDRDRLAERPARVERTREPVDAVYLWVDGADPAFRRMLRRYRSAEAAGDDDVGGMRRFRDNGELRFSLRSLERYAPWIRRIYVVTNGQTPAWLNRSDPRLSIVPHEAIFPDRRHLPTFNSLAIEAHIHRVPGLSDRFIYLNDDVFFGRPTAPEDFIVADGRQRVYLADWRAPDGTLSGPVHDRSRAYTQRLLDRAFGPLPERLAIAHTPQLFDSEIIRRVQGMLPAEVERTSSHRFRSATDVAFSLLYGYAALELVGANGRAIPTAQADGTADYCFGMIVEDRPRLERRLRQLATLRPKFFCLNDDLSDAPDPAILCALGAFLDAYFPVASRFEAEPSDPLRSVRLAADNA